MNGVMSTSSPNTRDCIGVEINHVLSDMSIYRRDCIRELTRFRAFCNLYCTTEPPLSSQLPAYLCYGKDMYSTESR